MRARKSFCATARFACRIPSSVMGAGASKLMIRTPRLDRDSPRSLQPLRQNLHLPAAVFSALRPLQPHRSQPGAAALLPGRLCWEDAAPTVKDPDRVADPSTLRRWFRHLDSSRPPFSALRRTMLAISAWLGRTELLVHNSLPLHWHTVYPFLARFWPLRI